ncbi:MAG TPA: type I DNA topoisomerase [Polyangiaceae bacterium]
MAKALVIVESPAKARTIAGFLGNDFVVEPSIGHIRDLPRSASEIPAAYKGEAWARLGVDVDNGFKPLYVIAKERQDQVRRLRSLVRDASEVYLATDEDREGESIAWHLLEVLAPQVPVKRMVFHEITRSAIESAIANPRELDRRLVDAQEARRILDRLYGYELSPLLWKKVMAGLSAGRVQSVATRVVVERERERMAFRSSDWWSLEARFATEAAEHFSATLESLAGTKVADGADFTARGTLERPGSALVLDEATAGELAGALSGAQYAVSAVENRPYRRSPAAPFITSTLQQEAARKLHFSAQRAMQVAQRLYEQGYITYMRTDSTTLSDTALSAARAAATSLYGEANVSKTPRTYDRRVKNAQEAHEAIRPAGESFRQPAAVAAEVGRDESRLYELVWQRTVASQMIDATGTSARVRIVGATTTATSFAPLGSAAEFNASGTVITSPGFLRVYVEGNDESDDGRTEEVRLPQLVAGDRLSADELTTEGHATRPPARFTEASLVKRLEELGVGRPSTYASIMQTVQDRGYVWKRGSALVPSFTAFAVVGLLESYFPSLVDYGFTASMEDDLDEIAGGTEEAIPWLERFYFGLQGPEDVSAPGDEGLKRAVLERLGTIDAREVNSIPIGADENGEVIAVRVGRYGPFLQRGEDRAPVPEDLPPDELTPEHALELLAAPSGERELGPDPETGLMISVRSGRFGPYVQVGEAEGNEKPKTASLFKSMLPDSVTLEDALRVLGLPRVVGTDPGTGEEIIARNGRYGPYLQRGTDSRSLTEEDELLVVTLEAALALFAQPKQSRFGRAAASPAKEIGPDPDSGTMIMLRSGKFGPYVTDGTINASLRRGDDEETLTLERAAELLAEKRAAGPATPRGKKAGAKKAGTKKAGAKKAGAPAKSATPKRIVPKKTAAKKTVAKKTTATKTAAKKTVAPRTGTPTTAADDEPF